MTTTSTTYDIQTAHSVGANGAVVWSHVSRWHDCDTALKEVQRLKERRMMRAGDEHPHLAYRVVEQVTETRVIDCELPPTLIKALTARRDTNAPIRNQT